ncbi:hypothetical protein FB45DRAFT_1036778 [Roridomyces roridus]|uniref:Protein kinase domain-containing protein n=1 Tax=Roridomyces roridus TaxID=1738132 RepID=A0AAD7B7G4_9AGAR|nr:hypothetical protein FB45DRAFT_1036778 [Roridomyces roridus]
MQDFITPLDFNHALTIASSTTRRAAWKALDIDNVARLASAWTEGSDSSPEAGGTIVLVGGTVGTFGTAATVLIRYERNEAMDMCVENTALDDPHGNPLDDTVISQVLQKYPELFKANHRTVVDFASQPNGEFTTNVYLANQPMGLDMLTGAWSTVRLSSLRWTHRLQARHSLYLVTGNGDSVQVFKEAEDDAPINLFFFTTLPNTDVLVAPTHVVVDDLERFHGLLMDYHPAGSLKSVLASGATVELPWTVKLVWACDVAAGIHFLHSHSVVWGDIKTSNVILCKDGHCRLIDYCPEGSTTAWYPRQVFEPEAQGLPSFADDAGALGLVLWSIAVDEVQLPWEVEVTLAEEEGEEDNRWDHTVGRKMHQDD